jgi:hypothetical protein
VGAARGTGLGGGRRGRGSCWTAAPRAWGAGNLGEKTWKTYRWGSTHPIQRCSCAAAAESRSRRCRKLATGAWRGGGRVREGKAAGNTPLLHLLFGGANTRFLRPPSCSEPSAALGTDPKGAVWGRRASWWARGIGRKEAVGRSEERTTTAAQTNKCGVRERIKQENNS